MPAPKRRKKSPPAPPALEYELEVLPGLGAAAQAELSEVPQLRGLKETQGGFGFLHPVPERLARLRSGVAVYRVLRADVPRPRGLLGHAHMSKLLTELKPVLEAGKHRSLRISAAGKESEVIKRLGEEISAGLGIPQAEDGELLLRLRPAASERGGWEVLARTTPLPLSARAWRVCNRAGGLNASIAYAMHKLAGVRADDRVFNPMLGSGTLLIERALLGPASALVGVDTDPEAVACARANLQASGKQAEMVVKDALDTGLPPRSFDLIVSDLPWGDAVGSAKDNRALYPAFLQEMYRLCSKGGRMVLLTHQIRLLEEVLPESPWHARELFQTYSGGHHPKAYLLGRRA